MYDTPAEMPNTPQSCLVCHERCSSRRLGLMLCAGKVLQRGAEGALNQGSKQHAQLQKAAQCRPDRGIARKACLQGNSLSAHERFPAIG